MDEWKEVPWETLQVGDVICWNKYADRSYEITAKLSKYTYAFFERTTWKRWTSYGSANFYPSHIYLLVKAKSKEEKILAKIKYLDQKFITRKFKLNETN